MKISDVMSLEDKKAKTTVGVIDLNSKLEPNAKICTGCGDLLPSSRDTGHFGLPGVRTDSNGKVIQQYKKNPVTKKVDTTNN